MVTLKSKRYQVPLNCMRPHHGVIYSKVQKQAATPYQNTVYQNDVSDLCSLDRILNDAVTQLRLILVMSWYGINAAMGLTFLPLIWRKGCLADSWIFGDWSFLHAQVLPVAKKLSFSLTNQGVILLDEILSLLRGVSIRYLFRIHFLGSLIETYVTAKTYVTTLIYTAIPNFLVGFYHYPT